MPWRFRSGEDGPIICTGPGCQDGYLPCPVDHASQPLIKDDDGDWYFRCEECDWVIPDTYGENNYETAGMIYCPECCAGERNDTYDGPCDRCRKLGRAATFHYWPDDLADYEAAKDFRCSWSYTCPKCWNKELAEERRSADAWRAEEARRQAAAARELEAYLEQQRRHREQHPVGTCNGCGNIRELALCEPTLDLFLCHTCAPGGQIPDQTTTTSTNAAPGWYTDPDAGPGWVRYWTGQRWDDGDPVRTYELETT